MRNTIAILFVCAVVAAGLGLYGLLGGPALHAAGLPVAALMTFAIAAVIDLRA